MKFDNRVCPKPSNDRDKFELDRTRSKNNIAENSVALGHDTHTRHWRLQDRKATRNYFFSHFEGKRVVMSFIIEMT